MSDKIIHLTSNEFNNLKGTSNDVYLIDFWAPWCGPCKAMEPMLDRLSMDKDLENVHFAKIDIDENEASAVEFNIQGIPNFVILQFDAKNQSYKILANIVGMQTNPLDFKMKILTAAKSAKSNIDFAQV